MDSGFYFSFASALDTAFYFALEADFGFGYGLGLVLNAAEVTLSILLSICWSYIFSLPSTFLNSSSILNSSTVKFLKLAIYK